MNSFPKLNSKIFVYGSNYYEFAHIGWNCTMSGQLYSYITGYKQAADLIIENALNKKEISILDSCVFPACFLYRQYLELSLKHLYLAYSQDTKDEKINTIKSSGHNLIKLWQKAKILIEETFPNDDKDILKAVELYISEFAQKDISSFAFRYPFDKSLNLIHKNEERINLRNLMERIEEIDIFLSGVDAGIDNAIRNKYDYSDEIDYY